MPVLIEEKQGPLEQVKATVRANAASPAAARAWKLAVAALVSAVVSTLIAAVFVGSIGRMASHLLFIAIVAVIGMAMQRLRFVIDRFDAGLVLALFLFEPLGRMLLHQEAVPAYALAAFPLALGAAYFFGRHDHPIEESLEEETQEPA
jgi:hypothetical protein